MLMAIRFTGFSTKNKSAINHVLTGKDLVIEDLMNHIMTRKGERVMMPTYGSIIHDLIFEPLTEPVKELGSYKASANLHKEVIKSFDFEVVAE